MSRRGDPSRSFALRLTRMVAVVSGLAVGLVCVAYVAMQVTRMGRDAREAVSAQARVIAANSTAALDFDNAEDARETLSGLGTVPEFAAAEIRKPDGSVFASFRRSEERLPELGAEGDAGTGWRWLVLSQPIVRDGERIGSLRLLYDMAPARRRLLLDTALAAAVAAAAVGLSFLAAVRIQRSLLRPIRELTEAAESISTTEDYTIRARKVSEDELGALTEVFNSMIARIGEAEALRRNHREMLEQEVAARTAEVMDAQARLRASERLASLGTLSAGLGHDIGNLLMPLRSHIAAISDKLRGAGELDAETERDFTAIAKATEYLQNLSAGLRLLAHSPNEAAVRQQATSLPELWPELEPLLHAVVGRGIGLTFRAGEGLPRVKLGRNLLMQAVFNLVQNAAQAISAEGVEAPAGARIEVSAEGGTEAVVKITVRDNGPGMDEEVLRRCMEPYFTTKTRRISSGLGLPLVKGIVEGAGGTIGVESAPGRGSAFTLLLPAEVSEAAGPRVRAVVTLRDARRRAVVSHMLSAFNCEVTDMTEAGEGVNGRGVWVTDAVHAVSPGWTGRVVVLGDLLDGDAPAADRMTVLPASTSLPALRGFFQRFLSEL